MFDKIVNHPELKKIICDNCSENNTFVGFDESLKTNGNLNKTKVFILKPDSFYHSSRMGNDTPPSPDCLILVNCIDKNQYDLYLIELRDVKDTRNLKYKIIVEKFKTMIDKFFVEFTDIFNPIEYSKIEFYLVTTYPKNGKNLSEEEYRKRIKGTALDVYASQKPLKLYNKAVLIEPRASLTIMPC